MDGILDCTICSCGSLLVDPEPCPYDVDVNGNPDSLCSCCDECRSDCADSI